MCVYLAWSSGHSINDNNLYLMLYNFNYHCSRINNSGLLFFNKEFQLRFKSFWGYKIYSIYFDVGSVLFFVSD